MYNFLIYAQKERARGRNKMRQAVITLVVLTTVIACTSARHTADDFEAVTFLEEYGYLDEMAGEGRTRFHAPDNVKAAIKEYQRFSGLAETGRLDQPTLELMTTPRCGNKDVIPPSERRLAKRFRTLVFRGAQPWKKRELTFRFLSYTDDLPREVQRKNIIKAFSKWAAVTPFTFTESTEGPVDIRLSFVVRDHGGPFQFYIGGALAHAFWPGMSSKLKWRYGLTDDQLDGDIHFNDDITWSESLTKKDGTKNLYEVALHEIGHTLAMDHFENGHAVMNPIHRNGDGEELTHDDIQGVQSLYGKP